MPAHRFSAALAGAALLASASASAADSPFIPDALYGTYGYSKGAFVAVFAAGASWDLKKRPPAHDESGLGIRLDEDLRSAVALLTDLSKMTAGQPGWPRASR